MSKDQKRKLFSLGRGCSPAKSYMFRLLISEDEGFVRDFPTAIEAVRGELEDVGVSKKTMQGVKLRLSGIYIEIEGEEELLAEIERLHKRFWKKNRE